MVVKLHKILWIWRKAYLIARITLFSLDDMTTSIPTITIYDSVVGISVFDLNTCNLHTSTLDIEKTIVGSVIETQDSIVSISSVDAHNSGVYGSAFDMKHRIWSTLMLMIHFVKVICSI